MARKSHKDKLGIIAFLEYWGPASVEEIANALGLEWAQGNKRVSLKKLLALMLRDHILAKPERGIYDLSASYRRRPLDEQSSNEQLLYQFALERGGIVARKEVMADLSVDEGYEKFQMDKAFRESLRFCRFIVGLRGVWALKEEERLHVPFIGKWALKQIQAASGRDSWEAARAEYCRKIGNAFADARGFLDIRDIVSDPQVLAALTVMADAAPGTLARARDDLEQDITSEATASGINDKSAINAMVRRRKGAELLAHLYAHFEAGAPALHHNAPVGLYNACAALFGVCPGALSRGRVVRVLPGIERWPAYANTLGL